MSLSPDARLTALVVDDEALGRSRVVNLLADRTDVTVIGEAESGEEALEVIQEASPDLLFLDVRMNEMDGFELLRQLGPDRPHVILVTAHEEHALDGFDEEAVDFLLKPFDGERFATAVDRAVRRARGQRSEALLARVQELVGAADAPITRDESTDIPIGDRPLKRLVVRSRATKILVDVDEIRWIEAANYYARLHTTGDTHLIRRSLSWLEEHLDPHRFVRIHRSSIVNIEHVEKISPWSGGSYDVRLDDGTKLRLSDARKSDIERLLRQSL